MFPPMYPYGAGYGGYGGYGGYSQGGTNGGGTNGQSQGQSGGNGQGGQPGAGGYGGTSGGQTQGQQGQGSGGSGLPGGQGYGRITSTGTAGPTSGIDREGPFPVPFFRMDHAVRKLDLTREQFDRLTTLTVQLQARFQPEIEKANHFATERQRESRRDEVLRQYGEEWLKAAQEVLSDEQMNRYRELAPQSSLP